MVSFNLAYPAITISHLGVYEVRCPPEKLYCVALGIQNIRPPRPTRTHSIHCFGHLSLPWEKVEDYIQVFEPYRETYKANNEHMNNVKDAYTNSTLGEFRQAVNKYKGMTEDFEAIPAGATVRPTKQREDVEKAGGNGSR